MKQRIVLMALAASFMWSGSWAGESTYWDSDNNKCVEGAFDEYYAPLAQPYDLAELRGLKCSGLWLRRNAIHASKGYCFTSDRGKCEFKGQEACTTQFLPDLNELEEASVAMVQQVESELGCQD